MEQLHDMDMSSPRWLTRFKTLKHDYEHHMDEEEKDIFSRARDEIGKDTSGEIGRRFRARKSDETGLVEKKAEEALED